MTAYDPYPRKMKIFKLDRRYKNFTKYGHVIGVKFIGFNTDAGRLENYLVDNYPCQDFMVRDQWDGYFLKSVKFYRGLGRRTLYLFTLKDESMLTMFLLKNQQLSNLAEIS